ncbi:MAG: saccharopine dehydrogenase NADP-binding domain-containing protein [Bacteroidales bacterium]|jgi:saccharopine dehydrogenase-like NADP-dependent oxidoreductase|nr:saccharopine dehydrogenase NADP-binding domain-containing protein [Bacteroidales bacterium]
MRRVAVLGAGYVVKPMIDYFIDTCKYEVIVATRTVSKAEKIIAGRPLGTSISWTIDQVDALEKIIQDVEVVVVMIPRSCHTIVAELCLKNKTAMITTDFKHPGIECFDEEAKKQETLILTELGEDPGLDNMGLKQMIDEVHTKGGKVTRIDSFGSGIPSYEHNRNPWGYKFSWDPNGLMRSAVSPATYQIDGKIIEVPAKFEHHRLVDVYGIGTFETYPSNDSTRYLKEFGLDKNLTIYKGLLRYIGYCNTMVNLLKIKLIENSKENNFENTTYSQFIANLIGSASAKDIKSKFAKAMKMDIKDDFVKKLDWLGLFDDVQISLNNGTNSNLLVDLMLKKMEYQPYEKDMIIVHNEMLVEFPDRKEKRISSMVVEGIPYGDSAMARAVSLPPAIATKLILDGKITSKGVCIPSKKEMYEPILEEMETFGFSFKKETIVL